MPKEARIGLLLAAAACLMAVLADWAVAELTSNGTQEDEVEVIVVETELEGPTAARPFSP
jgi:hypothetical protein